MSQLNRDICPVKITVLLGVLTDQPAVSFPRDRSPEGEGRGSEGERENG